MINYYYSNSDTNYSQIFKDLNLAEYSKCIVFLNGEIGSGKTSIVRSYIKLFNLNKTITSPTFPLINEYQLASKVKYYGSVPFGEKILKFFRKTDIYIFLV